MTIQDITGLGATGIDGQMVLTSARLDDDVNGDGGLTLSWRSLTGGVIAAGTTVGGYVMMEPYAPSRGDDGVYSYSPRFSSPAALLGKTLYYKEIDSTDAEDNETTATLYTFSYTGTPATLISSFGSSLPEGWSCTMGSQEQFPATISVSFDGDTIKSAAQKIAEACGVTLLYVGKTIQFGATDVYSGDGYYNRFVVLGGTRNMGKKVASGGYQAITQRLTIDTEGSVLDYSSGAPAMTKLLILDHIYPKMELEVASVAERRCYLFDEQGRKIPDNEFVSGFKEYSKWYVTLRNTDGTPYTFDTSLLIEDKPLGILFQSGVLNGREFELVYFEQATSEKGTDDVNQGSSFPVSAGSYRIVFVADGDTILPSISGSQLNQGATAFSGLVPSVGDKVTLTNIVMDSAYIAIAKRKLREEGEAIAAIYSSNAPASDSETIIEGTDVITGQGGGTVPALGSAYGGYIVTAIHRDLISGKAQVDYGTFSKKGLISSLVDKVEAVQTAGGAATEDEGTKSLSSDSFRTLQLAGGNVGFYLLNQKVDAIDLTDTQSILGGIGYLLYDTIKDYITDSYVTLAIDQMGNASLTTAGGQSVTMPSSQELGTLIEAFFEKTGSTSLNIFDDQRLGTEGVFDVNDLCVRPINVSMYKGGASKELVEGGVEVLAYTGSRWELVREYTAALISNLGDEIGTIVFGSNGSGGIVSRIGTVEAFAQQFNKDENGNVVGVHGSSLVLTGSDGTLSTTYTYTDPETGDEHNVTASLGTKVYYDETTDEWVSKIDLDADNVTIESDLLAVIADHIQVDASNINFSATESFKAAVGNSGVVLRQDGAGQNEILFGTLDGDNGEFLQGLRFVTSTVDGVKKSSLQLTADNCTISGNAISAAAHSIGLLMKSYTAQGGSFSIGYYDNNDTFQSVFSFIRQNDVTKLNLTADKATIDAESIDFSGKTITLSAATSIGLNAEQVTFGGSTVTLGSRDSQFTISGGNILVSGAELRFATSQRGSIDFTSATVKMNASQISFTSGGSTLNLERGIVTLLTNNLTQDGDKKAFGSTLGLVMREDHQGGSFSLGSYVYDSVSEQYVLDGGLEFIRETVDGQQKTKLNLTANNCSISADSIDFTASQSLTVAVRDLGVLIKNGSMSTDTEAVFGYNDNGTFRPAILFAKVTEQEYDETTQETVSVTKTKLVMTADNIMLTNDLMSDTGFVVRRVNPSNANEIFLGTLDANGNFVQGLRFLKTTESGQEYTKLQLDANNVSIDADSIDFSASSSFRLAVGNLGAVIKSDMSGDYFSLNYLNGNRLASFMLFQNVIDQQTQQTTAHLILNADNCTINGNCVSIENNGTPVALFSQGKVTASLLDAQAIVTDALNAGVVTAGTAQITNLNAVNLHVTGDSTFNGKVEGEVVAQDLYRKECIYYGGGVYYEKCFYCASANRQPLEQYKYYTEEQITAAGYSDGNEDLIQCSGSADIILMIPDSGEDGYYSNAPVLLPRPEDFRGKVVEVSGWSRFQAAEQPMYVSCVKTQAIAQTISYDNGFYPSDISDNITLMTGKTWKLKSMEIGNHGWLWVNLSFH